MTSTQPTTDSDQPPWYRQPWFWIVMSPLILVIIACAITITIAVRNADDLVTGNYYKEGLLINQKLDARTVGREWGLAGRVDFGANGGELRIVLSAQDASALRRLAQRPVQLVLTHPADAELDRTVVLRPQGDGIYRGELQELQQLATDRWYLTLTPASDSINNTGDSVEKSVNPSQWRLVGEIDFSNTTAAELRVP